MKYNKHFWTIADKAFQSSPVESVKFANLYSLMGIVAKNNRDEKKVKSIYRRAHKMLCSMIENKAKKKTTKRKAI
jgi:hypothetical protein